MACNKWMPLAQENCVRNEAGHKGKCETRASRDRRKARWRSYMVDRRFAKYGMTRESFMKLLESQGSSCAYCGTDLVVEGRKVNSAFIDHDHGCCPNKDSTCGYCVRGILCPKCNTAMGVLGLDDLSQLHRLESYLRQRINTKSGEVEANFLPPTTPL